MKSARSISIMLYIVCSFNNFSLAQKEASNAFITQQDCVSSSFVSETRLFIYPKQHLKLFNYESNLDSIILKLNGRILTKKDTIHYNPEKNYRLKIESIVPMQQLNKYLQFETDNSNYKTYNIPIHFGHYEINSISETFLIETEKICQDSFTIIFPYAGTQTDIELFDENDVKQEKPICRLSYLLGWGGNKIRISKNQTGCYTTNLRACYSSGRFDLIIE